MPQSPERQLHKARRIIPPVNPTSPTSHQRDDNLRPSQAQAWHPVNIQRQNALDGSAPPASKRHLRFGHHLGPIGGFVDANSPSLASHGAASTQSRDAVLGYGLVENPPPTQECAHTTMPKALRPTTTQAPSGTKRRLSTINSTEHPSARRRGTNSTPNVAQNVYSQLTETEDVQPTVLPRLMIRRNAVSGASSEQNIVRDPQQPLNVGEPHTASPAPGATATIIDNNSAQRSSTTVESPAVVGVTSGGAMLPGEVKNSGGHKEDTSLTQLLPGFKFSRNDG
jgi:hypothetical protein